MNIAFIGLGNYGKAIASLVEHNGYDYDYAEAMENRLLSKPAGLVFLTVPTQFVRQALKDNKQYLTDETTIVNCSKGIEESSHLMVHQIVRSVSRYPFYYSLIGPSFANGILEEHPTVVSLGYKREDHLEAIRKVLETPYFKVQPSKGYRSLELASALKNLYAILCGYAHGLGYGPNTQAQIITLALGEFRTMAKALHFVDYGVMTPGVVGDLVLTCTSEESRNFQYGLGLATGEIRQGETPQHTVEGYHTSRSINIIAKEHGTKLPLAELTADIISGKVSGKKAFQDFLQTI
jgi:glycerol-3-phosphate dehydrogenase (NAD(P)+)